MTQPTLLFLFGTLRHVPLLNIVLGTDVGSRVKTARLDGYDTVLFVKEGSPVLVPTGGASVEGIVLSGLTDQERLRLDYYECEYALAADTITVETSEGKVQAAIYELPGEWELGGRWDFDDWLSATGDIAIEAAREVMAYPKLVDADELDARWPTVLMRASSTVRAQTETRARVIGQMDAASVDVAARRHPYTSYFSFAEMDLRYASFGGGMGPKVKREAMHAADAVTVLPYDPVRDRVLVVEQFRFGTYARGDTHPWCLEPIAGRIDPGETPEDTARRESVEEAGLTLGDLLPVANYYPSPGALTEYLYTYVAIADLPDEAAGLGGLEIEAEDIMAHVISFDRLMDAITSGEANNGPLILTALWLQRERPRLRSAQ